MNPEALVEAAGLVADGVMPDWGSVSSGLSTDDERAIADELAGIARVAQGHRRLHDLLPLDGSGQVPLDRSTWGHLELLEVLGRGSYGTVYRAWDGRLDRQVALKLFHGPRDPEAVMNEGRMLAKIRHHNVVAVYGADVIDGGAGIWMEFVRGRNLEQIIKEHGPMSAAEATLIGLDMARALAAVHGAGLLHCDIKAQNVVREPGGRLVLMDLGASRAVPGTDDTTSIGHVSGTPRYMAPELFDRAPASPQSDIYSLGVLLFFLVTNRFPVEGGTLSEIRQAQKQGRLTHLRDVRPELPAGYLREVARALERNPIARHHSAGELEAGLLSLSAAAATVPATSAPAPNRVARMVQVLIALALALVVGGALLAWYSRPAVPSEGARSIAVLPIRNLTGDASKNYLADGLTEVLISNLARVRGLRVPSLSAVMPFRESPDGSRTIAEKLGVQIVLAGSVATAGDTVRLGVQLIDPATDTVEWSEELTVPSAGLLAAQGEIARLVATRLSVALTPAENRGLRQSPLNPAAQDAFLRGLVALHPGADLNTATMAVAHFRRAVSLEPRFAAAWAHLALAELRLVDRVADIDRAAKAAEIATMAETAIEVDPTLETGYLALGTAQFYHDWNFAAAEQTLRAGLERSPSSAVSMQRLASLLAAVGRLDEAIVLGEASRSLEPLVPLRSTSLGTTYYYARDFARAEAEMKRALEIQPEFAVGHFGLARVYSAIGRHAEAIAQVQLALAGIRTPAYLAEAARIYQAAGQSDMAGTIVRKLEDRERRGEAYGVDNLAYIAAAAGRLDEAFAILDTAVQQRLTNVLWIGVDPRADALRGDPRFTALLARIGVRQ